MKISLGVISVIIIGLVMSLFLDNKKGNSELRVAFPSQTSASKYEPTKIHLGHEYIFLENIYSSLFEIDPQSGQVLPGVARSFRWNGDELILEIRDDLRTKSGKLITAADVEFSLKRLLVLSGNTHGNFRDLVCPGSSPTSIFDECKGIKRDKNNIILSVGNRKPFLIPMLAAIDFAIIPQTSVDPTTLAIIDYAETSGPYYVFSDDSAGSIKLKANSHHYRYAPDMPQYIKLVPVDLSKKSHAVTLFEMGEVDHLTTIDQSAPEDVFQYYKSHEDDVRLHSTHRIRNLSLVFTEKGQKRFNPKQRHKIGSLIRSAMIEVLKAKSTYLPTDDFFSPLAEGGLDLSEKDIIQKNIVNSMMEKMPNLKPRIGIIKNSDISPWRDEIVKFIPQADVYQESNVPDFKGYKSEDEIPDMFLASTDTGFSEDINLISYTLAAGFFGLSKQERQEWLAEYMENDNKPIRIEKLKAIHFRALKEGVITPIASAPFFALVRKPWKMGLSQLHANNQLWLIRQ